MALRRPRLAAALAATSAALLAHAAVARVLPDACELPHIVYINLERRADRRASIETQAAVLGWPPERVHRLNATTDANGLVGCFDSHRRALQLAVDAGWPDVLVLEDDALFRNLRHARAQLCAFRRWEAAAVEAAAQPVDTGKQPGAALQQHRGDRPGRRRRHPWDVVLLSGIRREVVAEEPVPGAGGPAPWALSLRRAARYQTTAAYMAAAHYLPTLAASAARSVELLRAEPAAHAWHAWDQRWKAHQEADEWLHFEPMLADQAPGRSDITGLDADYARAYGGYEALRAALHAGTPAHALSWQLEWDSNTYLGRPPPSPRPLPASAAVAQQQHAGPPAPETVPAAPRAGDPFAAGAP
jgi:hypothetical protein